MKLSKITRSIESLAPPSLQESYDNSGLLVGDPGQEVKKALISLDVTEEVVEEAINSGAQLIISHHPVIFKGLKQLTGRNYVERSVIKAIRNNIALYAVHTNLDNVVDGVNAMLAEKLGLENREILRSKRNVLKKLATFCPNMKNQKGEYIPGQVRQALFEAGAGIMGNYDKSSFNARGRGTFRAPEDADPYVGKKGQMHVQNEIRLETLFPAFLQSKVIEKLLEVHPYEEVAYDIYPLENEPFGIGGGIIGNLKEATQESKFLEKIKKVFNAGVIRHTPLLDKPVKKVAACGGAGGFLLPDALGKKADVFITADFKYHQFFDAEGKIVIADIGHYESEQFTVDLLFNYMKENFPTFAVLKSSVNTNPIRYL